MRVDNRVAERRPHNELDQREPGWTHPVGTGGTRRGLIVGKTTSPAARSRSGDSLGACQGSSSRCSWGGLPGMQSSSPWRPCEGQVR